MNKILSNCIKTLDNDRRFLIIVFLISFVLGSFFFFCFRPPLESDAIEYDKIGWNLAQGNGFSSQASAPFTPTMNRAPIYPFFLGAIYKIFGHNYVVVSFFQILIFGLTCLLVYFLAQDVFDKKIAKYSTVLISLCPTLANYPSYLLTETVFTFLLCSSILALTKAVKTQGVIWFLFSGVILGLTTLCRVVMLLYLFVFFFGMYLLKEDWKYFLKRSVFHLIIFSFAFFMIASPWIYRNYHLFGCAQIRLRGGATLWEKAIMLDDSLEDMKQAAVFNFSEYLGNLLFPGVVDNPRDFILKHLKKSRAYESQLRQQNLTPVEIDNIMKKEAFEKIKERPFKYLAQSLLELEKMTAFIYVPALNETYISNKFNRLKNGRLLLSGIRGLFRLTAYPLIVLAIMGIWINRKQWQKWYFLFAIIVYTNLIYSLLFGLGRYAVPLIPYYLIFASSRIPKVKKKYKK